MHALRCNDSASTTTAAVSAASAATSQLAGTSSSSSSSSSSSTSNSDTLTSSSIGVGAGVGDSSSSSSSVLPPHPLQHQQHSQQQQHQHSAPPQPPKGGGPVRLNGIKGYQNRTNHIIYCPPLLRSKDECAAVVYFGGDVQDIPEKMETNRDNKNYIKWNLENTALLLRDSFPRSHIVVVRPMRMEYSTFSCFDNFVRGNNAGIPDHTPMHYSLQHLEELLINLTKKLTKPVLEPELMQKLVAATNSPLCPTTGNPHTDLDVLQGDGHNHASSAGTGTSSECDTDDNHAAANAGSSSPSTSSGSCSASNNDDINELLWWRESLNLDKANIALMGFSKGCVVLNQFIYEFHYYKTLTPDDSTMMRLVSRIKDMYWLDGGHGGGKNTWITSRSLLETLCRLGINIHVHVTPYQIQDDHRPWIRKEEKAFTDLLKRLGSPFDRHLYPSEANSTNLFTHFEVLNRFRQYQINVFAQQHLQQQQQLTATNLSTTTSTDDDVQQAFDDAQKTIESDTTDVEDDKQSIEDDEVEDDEENGPK
ncbi:mitochondrial protein C2orf69 homolog [Uranotaenia lowii]|uniref:mitochondrial protein C2orf69 homolog n=1 Tax=Uranotaenia lowii TaxID=190385 RepID=UPI002479E87F|nr:mitochondrial protein C2orf69 homolog [Uranotaenia lowii]